MLSGLGQRAHNTPHMPQLREHGRGHNAEAAQNIQNPTAPAYPERCPAGESI